MTVIDVNSGKHTRKNEERNEMIRVVNNEAATEVAYQLKLRNISGMILVDFINYEDKKDEDKKHIIHQCDTAVGRLFE